MYEKVLSAHTKKDLKLLADSGLIDDFYLAGGTAAALYLGHRVSFDLDLFSQKSFDNRAFIDRLKPLGKFSVEKESSGTIWCILNQTKLAFFFYDYPLLKKIEYYKDIKVASLLDIACMKLSAISSRGTKRDFIDLYMICQKRFKLKEILNAFMKKYKEVHYNIVHILKSLSYFEDARRDPMPKMLIRLDWPTVETYFQEEIVKQI